MYRNVNNSAPIQKYCKVCHDAGKDESVYRSHFTRESRDPKSKVTCPTLLDLNCRFCYKKGHTVKYCTVLKKNNRNLVTSRTQVPNKATEKPKCKSNNHNVFNVLDSDSDSKEEVIAPKVTEVKEEFPSLSTSALARTQSVSTNYVAALLRPVPLQPAATVIPFPVIQPAKIKTKIESRLAPWASSPKASTINWADTDTDSDDEEEPCKSYSMQIGQYCEPDYDSDW